MKGIVKNYRAGCAFARVEPEDLSEWLHLGRHNFPTGLSEGAEVEFTINPATPRPGQKREAIKVTLVGSAPSAASPVPKKAVERKPERKVAETRTTPQIMADAALDPDKRGRFKVTVCTRNRSGKPGEMNFRAVVVQGEKLRFFKKNGNGDVLCDSLSLRTGTTGQLELFVKFSGDQATVKFELDDGTSVETDFTK